MFKITQRLALDELVNKIGELMPLPTTVKTVLDLTKDPYTSLKLLGDTLEKDQAMASRVLKLANSSFYGFSRQVKTIPHAVVCLGFNTIKQMVLSAHTFGILENKVQAYELEKGEMARHSVAVAILSRELAQKLKHYNPDEIYLMGLLHDIGKVVLNEYADEIFTEVLHHNIKYKCEFFNSEKEIFGYNHAQVGSAVCEKWNLSEDLIKVIRYHHEPWLADWEDPLPGIIVYTANAVSLMMGIGNGIGGIGDGIREDIINIIGFKMEDIVKMIPSFMDILQNEDIFNSINEGE